MRVLSKERLDDFESRGPAGITHSDFMLLLNQSRAAQTPAASLAAHDAEVLERARVALNDAEADCECGNISAITTDKVIRALAAQAQEVTK